MLIGVVTTITADNGLFVGRAQNLINTNFSWMSVTQRRLQTVSTVLSSSWKSRETVKTVWDLSVLKSPL